MTTISVNGHKVNVGADPDTPLLWVLRDQLGLTDGGGFWGAVGALNDNFGVLGYCIVGIFALAWIVSVIVYRINGYDEIEATIS